ncbi:hypothetical protein A4A49_55791, partial [Nicotiana attenuata]
VATTTTRPVIGILPGSGASRIGTSLQVHPGKSTSNPDCPKPCASGEGNGRSPKQGLGGLWSMLVAGDDKQWQHATQFGPTNTQHPNLSSVPIDPLLPKPGNGGPSSVSGICNHRTLKPPNSVTFCSSREEPVTTDGKYHKENQQSLRSFKKENPTGNGRNSLRPPSHRLSPTRLNQSNRVQYGD